MTTQDRSLPAAVVHRPPVGPALHRWRPDLWGWLVPVALIVLLEALVRLGLLSALLFPPPSEVLATLQDLAHGKLWVHIGYSSARVLAGFAIGSLLGVLAATVIGLKRRAEQLLDPMFQGLRAIPGLAWVPLLLLWLGIDETPKITMIAIGAFFPVYLNVLSGIRNVDRKLIEVGEICGLSRRAQVWRIYLPASLPNLFTGLRNGLSVSWMFLVAAELIAATKGIGYLLTDGRETSRPDTVLAAIVVLAIVGKLSDSVLKTLEARTLAWRDVLETR